MRISLGRSVRAASLSALAIVFSAALGLHALANETTCKNQTWPSPCGAGCSAEITYADAPPVEGVCGGNKRVHITIKMDCGATTCTREFYVCESSTEQLQFTCNGQNFKLDPTGGQTWGNFPSQTGGATCNSVARTC